MDSLHNGKAVLTEQLNKTITEAISRVEDLKQKKILTSMLNRLTESLSLLDYLSVKIDKPYTKGGKAPSRLLKLALGPRIAIILLAVALLSGFILLFGGSSKFTIIMLLSTMLLLIRELVLLLQRAREADKPTADPAQAELMIETDLAQKFLERQEGKLVNDSAAYCALFVGETVTQNNSIEKDLAEMYTSLFEAQVENPRIDDFKYSITKAELILRQFGLIAVSYEEKPSLFDIDEEDYPSQMRFPAIVHAQDGTVVKKGFYIKNKSNQ